MERTTSYSRRYLDREAIRLAKSDANSRRKAGTARGPASRVSWTVDVRGSEVSPATFVVAYHIEAANGDGAFVKTQLVTSELL